MIFYTSRVSKTPAVRLTGYGGAVTAEQYDEGSCVWRRGPRPGKGRNSRTRRTPSPVAGPAAAAALLTTTAAMTTAASTTVAPGYEQYQKSLLEVPWPHAEYGEASSDDLSSEWDSDVPEPPPNSKVNNGIFIFLYNTQYFTAKITFRIILDHESCEITRHLRARTRPGGGGEGFGAEAAPKTNSFLSLLNY